MEQIPLEFGFESLINSGNLRNCGIELFPHPRTVTQTTYSKYSKLLVHKVWTGVQQVFYSDCVCN